MGEVPKEHEMTVRNHIRRFLIMDKNITNTEIKRQLDKAGIQPSSLPWIGKQRRKIIAEKYNRRLHYVIYDFLQDFIDTMTESDRKLWQIATSSDATNGEKIYALGEVRKNRQAIFDKLFEAGVFEKQLGKLTIESFMDFVRSTANAKQDSKLTDAGVPGAPRSLAERSGASDPGSLGTRLIDLVRASESDPVSGGEQTDSSK